MTRVYNVILAVIILLAFIVSWIFLLVYAIRNHKRLWPALRAADRYLNALSGGDEKETMSSHLARARDENRWYGCVLCKLLDSLDPNHCEKSKGI